MKKDSLKSVKEYLREGALDGFIFFKRDPLVGGYCFEKTDVVQRLSGFSGSYAVLLVTRDENYLFTDQRYAIRSKAEVLAGIEVLLEPYHEFINSSGYKKIGYDPDYANISDIEKIKQKQELVAVNGFIVELFGSPDLSSSNVIQDEFSDTVEEKMERLLKEMCDGKFDAYIGGAESMSWLLNERSNAIPYYPVSLGYVFVHSDGSYERFSHEEVMNGEMLAVLCKVKNLKLAADYGLLPASVVNTLEAQNDVLNTPDLIANIKKIKTETEIRNMKSAHIRESLMWLHLIDWIKNFEGDLYENALAEKILSLKQQRERFFDESFESIVANSKNAASIHYSPLNSKYKVDFMALIDTGTEYLDGTTDVTRCVTRQGYSIPAYAKYYYTTVLKSHIALATAVFPVGTNGAELNAIGRRPLWEENLDFKHGFGHGIGVFLNVHEPYVSISRYSKTVLQEGMIISNEPGVYLEGKIGIRIENAVLVEKCADVEFLKLSTLDFVPFEADLIDESLLTVAEIEWINEYYNEAKEVLGKHADEEEKKLIEKYFNEISL